MADAQVTNVKIKGDLVILTSQYKLSDLHADRDFVTYSMKEAVQKTVVKAISDKLFEKYGKKIISQILKEVNWPDIVRSEIARKVIAEAGKENRGY